MSAVDRWMWARKQKKKTKIKIKPTPSSEVGSGNRFVLSIVCLQSACPKMGNLTIGRLWNRLTVNRCCGGDCALILAQIARTIHKRMCFWVHTKMGRKLTGVLLSMKFRNQWQQIRSVLVVSDKCGARFHVQYLRDFLTVLPNKLKKKETFMEWKPIIIIITAVLAHVHVCARAHFKRHQCSSVHSISIQFWSLCNWWWLWPCVCASKCLPYLRIEYTDELLSREKCL